MHRSIKLLTLGLALLLFFGMAAAQDQDPNEAAPEIVNVPGTIQPELGCPGPWAPDCEATLLEYNADYDVWLRTFESLPAGSYEYKVALNGSWDENYGASADANGPNIMLNQPEDGPITFVYDDKTNWIADDARHVIATVPGNYQDEIGCPGEWQPDCLRSWLQDIDGDGIYQFSTEAIPAGSYEAKVAIGRSWDENYGLDGVRDGSNIPFTVAEDGASVTFLYDSDSNVLAINTGGGAISAASLRELRAHWVTEETLAWNIETSEENSYRLLYSAEADMRTTLFGLEGDFESLDLTVNPDGIPASAAEKFPHLAGYSAFTISEDDLSLVPEILKAQTAIAEYNADDELLNVNGIQIPGVLDDLYTYNGPLGVTFDEAGAPTISVWAPTARNVEFLLYADSAAGTQGTRFEMTPDADAGTWTITGEPDWYGQYYRFAVDVFRPLAGEFVLSEVTDPYSVSLSVNSLRSQIINLNDPELMPEGWMTLEKPALDAPEDITVYELHVRDFTSFDPDVPAEMVGTYAAFTLEDTAGIRHLQALAEAGLTHLHLLPTFDIATINENRSRWFLPEYSELEAMAPDSEGQQAAIGQLRDLDAFNWGYDPLHYNVPEGSYSMDPNGTPRILEYREMVQAINNMGLRFVQDVVYNHTNASGLDDKSVLDKLVPGYYHRLNALGRVETSTCCQNTATEHNMMRRLMLDSVVLHAVQYKVDGFRFDLMGHHMLPDMVAVREALDALTLEEHGVNGSEIYVYGEGWDFGEVVGGIRGVNATQENTAGTGIGTFNDRLRDAVRGGSPVDEARFRQQGLGNGLFSNPSEFHPTNTDLETALTFADQIRVGLAGNLRDFTFTDATGETVRGDEVAYNDQLTGYTQDPQENVLYVSKHDDQTLFDYTAAKSPVETTMEQRLRYQNLGLSFVMYAQGVPFFHAGSDMLRSKSGDNDSFNSGDWFNNIDFSYQQNGWGRGLPPAWAGGNEGRWPVWGPLLANPDLMPTQDHIMANVTAFRDMLQVRYSTPLFRLRTAEDILRRVNFHNTGPEQLPGVIAMSISDMGDDLADLDAAHEMLVVVFNTTPDEIGVTEEAVAGLEFVLHPTLAGGSDVVVQNASYDAETGTFSVPGLTTAVFVLPQS
jgi:pullulanase